MTQYFRFQKSIPPKRPIRKRVGEFVILTLRTRTRYVYLLCILLPWWFMRDVVLKWKKKK